MNKIILLLSILSLTIFIGCSSKIEYSPKSINDIESAKSIVEEYLLTQYHLPSRPESLKFNDKYISIEMPTTVRKSRMPSFGGHHLIINNNRYRLYYKNIKDFNFATKNSRYLVEPITTTEGYKLKFYSRTEEDAEHYYDAFNSIVNYYNINK